MSLLSKVKYGACMIADHPGLAGWYTRNKLRTATLSFERNHMEGVSRFARGITLRLTSACNLRCKMCRFVECGDVLTDPKLTLPLETWTSVIDDVARFRVYVTMTGGEPLIFPQIGQLIRRVREHDLRCTVTTNGTLLAKRAPDFMDYPPDLVVVSLDGPPEVHNEVRGQPKVFERAVEGIIALKKLKDERGQKDPLIVINAAITAWSYRTVDRMIDIARELGVDALNFQHQWSFTQRMVDEHNVKHGDFHPISFEDLGGADPPEVDLDEMVSVVGRIRDRAATSIEDGMVITMHPELKDSEIRAWYSDPHNWVQRRPAACAWINTEVQPNGDVEPCFGYVCGNVKEHRLSKIWNSYPYREYRRRLAAAEDYPICVRCCAYFRRD